MSAAVIATPAYAGFFGLFITVSVGAAAYLAAVVALDILGMRTRVATTFRDLAQSAFMERLNVRRP
jgi:hypothetical protein